MKEHNEDRSKNSAEIPDVHILASARKLAQRFNCDLLDVAFLFSAIICFALFLVEQKPTASNVFLGFLALALDLYKSLQVGVTRSKFFIFRYPMEVRRDTSPFLFTIVIICEGCLVLLAFFGFLELLFFSR